MRASRIFPMTSGARFQYVLANALTLANLTSGTAAILLPGEKRAARRSTLILVGALCDSGKGRRLARAKLRKTNRVRRGRGRRIRRDHLRPPAVVLARNGQITTRILRIAPGFYLAAAAWRVAKYGIGPRRSHVFRGLPITGAGVIFAAGCQLRLPPRALTLLAVALGVAMLSPIRVLSGEALIRRAPGRPWRSGYRATT